MGNKSPPALLRSPLSNLQARLAALLALATTLLCATPCQALPQGGPIPPPECAAGITARLTATPSSLDRETSTDTPTTSLTWSVTRPKDCPVPAFTVTLDGQTVPLSGTKRFALTSTKTFSLVLNNPNMHHTLASTRVTVAGDPGLITVSAGRQLAPDDITQFNQQWMQPFQVNQAHGSAFSGLSNRDPDVAWGTAERMVAMVRMYDLTHDRRYLDHLRDLVHLALQWRDDRPFDGPGPRPLELIRNMVGVPAWGGDGGTPTVEGVEYGGLSHVEEVISNIYAYPIAAFARIVAEDPSLQLLYGDEAVDAANKLFDTVSFFMPQIRSDNVGGFIQARLLQPTQFLNRPTQMDCSNAFNKAMADDAANQSRWTQQRNDCNLKRDVAGRDLPHNINLAFAMVLIELSRVIDSAYYEFSARRSTAAQLGRDVMVSTAIRQQR
jgi:hypothetical protein